MSGKREPTSRSSRAGLERIGWVANRDSRRNYSFPKRNSHERKTPQDGIRRRRDRFSDTREMLMKPEIIRTRSFVEDAASFIAHTAEQAIEEHGFFRLALSGGKTPRTVYQALALRECRWPKWIITFGDERCVS